MCRYAACMSAHYLADMPRNQRVADATTPPTSIGHTITEIALRHLLEARWQFVQAVNVQTDAAALSNGYSNGYVLDGYSYVADKVADKQGQKHRQPCRQCAEPSAEPSAEQPKYHQSSHQFATRQRGDVMAYWHVSNSYLEHTLLHLAQHVLESQTIDLNDLIEGIVACIVKPLPAQRPNPTRHNTPQHNHNPLQRGRYPVNANSNVENDSTKNGTIGFEALGVDVGIATTLPTVSAPLLLLHWVFSELLITSWLNSLPASLSASDSLSASEPHNVLPIPLTDMATTDVATTDVATVVVNCLDADDAWHITISSDHHHASLATAALTQLQAALQQIGGDMHVMCDDDALLQTVILPKVPRG